MKKILFMVVMLVGTISLYAQQKGSPEQRANEYTEYISNKIDFNRKETKFLNKTLVTKFTDASNKIKGNYLSKEEKKVIYKDSYEWTNKELKTKFSDKEVKEIFSLVKEYSKKSKK